MKQLSYTDILNETIRLYMDEKYKEAYDFISKNYLNTKVILPQIYNFRYAIASKMGRKKLALKLLAEAVNEKGFWYSYDYLMSDEDLALIREDESFVTIAELCKKREDEAVENTKAIIEIIEPQNKKEKNPLLIGLHGNQENVDFVKGYWNSDVFEDYFMALPQSSEIEFSQGYLWDDLTTGEQELKSHYESLVNKYPIDEDNVVIAGFSAGAGVAMEALISGAIPAKRVIFVAPWLPNMKTIRKNIAKLKEMKIEFYLVCGEADDDCFESTDDFAELLDKYNVPYEFVIVEGMDHTYPEPFDDMLTHAMSYFDRTMEPKLT